MCSVVLLAYSFENRLQGLFKDIRSSHLYAGPYTFMICPRSLHARARSIYGHDIHVHSNQIDSPHPHCLVLPTARTSLSFFIQHPLLTTSPSAPCPSEQPSPSAWRAGRRRSARGCLKALFGYESARRGCRGVLGIAPRSWSSR